MGSDVLGMIPEDGFVNGIPLRSPYSLFMGWRQVLDERFRAHDKFNHASSIWEGQYSIRSVSKFPGASFTVSIKEIVDKDEYLLHYCILPKSIVFLELCKANQPDLFG